MGGAAFDGISTLTSSAQVSFLWGRVTDHYRGGTVSPTQRYWETLTFSVLQTAETDAADSGNGSTPNWERYEHFIVCKYSKWHIESKPLYNVTDMWIHTKLTLLFEWLEQHTRDYLHMQASCRSTHQWPRKEASRLSRIPSSTFADSWS